MQNYYKMQNIFPALFSPTCKDLLFRPVLNSPSFNIHVDYIFYIRMFIRSCFEFAHCQLGEIKTMANKTHSTLIHLHLSNILCYMIQNNRHDSNRRTLQTPF